MVRTLNSRRTPVVPGRRLPSRHCIGLRSRHPHESGRTLGGLASIMKGIPEHAPTHWQGLQRDAGC